MELKEVYQKRRDSRIVDYFYNGTDKNEQLSNFHKLSILNSPQNGTDFKVENNEKNKMKDMILRLVKQDPQLKSLLYDELGTAKSNESSSDKQIFNFESLLPLILFDQTELIKEMKSKLGKSNFLLLYGNSGLGKIVSSLLYAKSVDQSLKICKIIPSNNEETILNEYKKLVGEKNSLAKSELLEEFRYFLEENRDETSTIRSLILIIFSNVQFDAFLDYIQELPITPNFKFIVTTDSKKVLKRLNSCKNSCFETIHFTPWLIDEKLSTLLQSKISQNQTIEKIIKIIETTKLILSPFNLSQVITLVQKIQLESQSSLIPEIKNQNELKFELYNRVVLHARKHMKDVKDIMFILSELDPNYIDLKFIHDIISSNIEKEIFDEILELLRTNLIVRINKVQNENYLTLHRLTKEELNAYLKKRKYENFDIKLQILVTINKYYSKLFENKNNELIDRKNIHNHGLLFVNNFYKIKNKLEFSNIYCELLDNVAKYYEIVLCDFKKSLTFYNKSLQIRKKVCKNSDRTEIAISLHNLGNVYDKMADYKKALDFKQKSLKLVRDLDEIDGPESAFILNSIGNTLMNINEIEKALDSYEQSLEIRNRLYMGDHPDIAQSLSQIGMVHQKLGDYKTSIEYFEKSLEIRKELHKEIHSTIMTLLTDIAFSNFMLNDYNKSLEYYKLALELSRILFDSSSSSKNYSIAIIFKQIGILNQMLNEFEKALENYKQSLEIFKKFYKKSHLDIADILSRIASAYADLCDYNRCLEYYKLSLEMRIYLFDSQKESEYTELQNLRAFYREVAQNLKNIAISYKNLNKYEQALEYFEKSLDLSNKINDKKNEADEEKLYYQIAKFYSELGDNYKALDFYKKTLNLAKKWTPDDTPYMANLYNYIGNSFNSIGEYNDALINFEQCLELRKSIYEENHADIASCTFSIACVYENLDDKEKALEYFKQYLDQRMSLYKGDHPIIEQALCKLGNLYEKMNQSKKAIEYFKISLEMKKKIYSNQDLEIATLLSNIGNSYRNLDDHEKSLEYYKLSIEIMINHFKNKDDSDLAKLFFNIGLAYEKSEMYENALKSYEKCLEMRKRLYANIHADIAHVLFRIGCVYLTQMDYFKGLEYLKLCLEMRKIIHNNVAHLDLITSLEFVANVFKKLSNFEKAVEFYIESLEMRKTLLKLSANDSELLEKQLDIANLMNKIGGLYKRSSEYQNALDFYNQSSDEFEKIFKKKAVQSSDDNKSYVEAKWNSIKENIEKLKEQN
jgi:tetratricopeptide (TPR) repeat protein